ncbi:hypothetical protein [Aquimarina litoralis]|uniref:hypothetical protein n=1 Tax=Aquimarina litoralis TaxID=584605 RepID=UPI001C57585D|nr:hypothetical protein [Aquimarina litoralis]MBW1294112.1 hypothetical protein [Aquimarina litoralis]
MTKNKYQIVFGVLFFSMPIIKAQTNSLTGSPYSLFGLGVQTNSNIGRNSGLGRGGIALESNDLLNTLNPASFASISDKSFLLDIGFLGELNKVSTNDKDENRFSSNFSNLAMGFSINKRSGMGISIVPFTDVGYALIGIKTNIEGSQEEFISNITGSGGLNDLSVFYGYQLFDNFSLGVRPSFLFGSIDQTENIIFNNTFLNVIEENYYNGFRLGFGLQYKIDDQYTIGFTSNSPTSLNGSQDRSVSKSLDFIPTEVEDENNLKIQKFKLPLELGLGAKATFFNSLTINLDYQGNLWGFTNQSDDIGDYVDQSIFSFGAEYRAKELGLKYWENIEFRAGFNYDSGYLKVNDEAIDNYSMTVGIGFPISVRGGSKLNISYATGKRGTVSGILVEENFNMINVNISLKDIWFRKLKFN